MGRSKGGGGKRGGSRGWRNREREMSEREGRRGSMQRFHDVIFVDGRSE